MKIFLYMTKMVVNNLIHYTFNR